MSDVFLITYYVPFTYFRCIFHFYIGALNKHSIKTPTVNIINMAGVFAEEATFCPNCGRILPLPELYDVIKCRTCPYNQKITSKSFYHSSTHHVIRIYE